MKTKTYYAYPAHKTGYAREQHDLLRRGAVLKSLSLKEPNKCTAFDVLTSLSKETFSDFEECARRNRVLFP